MQNSLGGDEIMSALTDLIFAGSNALPA